MFDAAFYNDNVEINEQQVLPQITQIPRREGGGLGICRLLKTHPGMRIVTGKPRMIKMIEGWSRAMDGYLDQKYISWMISEEFFSSPRDGSCVCVLCL